MDGLQAPAQLDAAARVGTGPTDAALRSMLEARSIAVVGASARPESFGRRLTLEALRSPSQPQVHLINPRYTDVLGHPCVPTLETLDEPVDLVLLGVPDTALLTQLELAGSRGDAGAVIFGSAHGQQAALASAAAAAGMALCGAGCMGFVNMVSGVRAIGYVERFPLHAGSIAFVSHSGSAFSALLRTHRRLAYSIAVSSGQELTTTAADYVRYALTLPQTCVLAVLLETLRDADGLCQAFDTAAASDVPVVALTVGGSPTGRAMVDAHSGAVAGDDAAWEALFDAYGVHRVADLDEMVDALEVFAMGPRARPGTSGVATVHDSGAERALVADVAEGIGLPFAPLAESTRAALTRLLEPGLPPTNPLDIWGTGADTRTLFTGCLEAVGNDPNVAAVALAIDLVEEYDGDESYVEAVLDAAASLETPLVVLSNLAAAVDQTRADRLRQAGVPVLEGTRTGLQAMRHLLNQSKSRPARPLWPPVDVARRGRWLERLSDGVDGETSMRLLADYGLAVAATATAACVEDAVAAADRLGYPVVLKTDAPAQLHKSDAGGVILGLTGADSVEEAYAQLSGRLGPRVLVQTQSPLGVELGLGLVRDPALGPLLVLVAGGTLVEVMSQRVVALPPIDEAGASRLLSSLPAARLLDGVRGRPPCDRAAVVSAIVAMSDLAGELGDRLDALDVNPLIATASGATAVDALVLPRPAGSAVPPPPRHRGDGLLT